MLGDYHIHSNFSGDSQEDLENIIEAALGRELVEIAITDHLDLDYPSPQIDFTLNLKEYLKVVRELRRRYRGRIDIKIGIELGLQPHLEDSKLLEDILRREVFDFIIASTHCAQRLDFEGDDFFRRRSKESAHKIYFEEVYENIKRFDGFSVVGHLDFIKRYGKNHYKDHKLIDYGKHDEIINKVLELIIQKGVGIEVNTSGFRYGLSEPTPGAYILRRYRELGGRIITIGSDAHSSEDVGEDLERAADLLKDLGYKHYCTFTNKKNNFLEL